MSLVFHKFVIDGIHWDFLPEGFGPALDSHAVRSVSYPQLDLQRIVVTEAAEPDAASPNIEMRRLHRQAWKAGWGSEAPMDICMRDQLELLYTTQQGFWIQFDDEMSRFAVQLLDFNGAGSVFFTPTYPIAPFGYTPGSGLTYQGMPRKNGGAWIQKFSIDSEIGKVQVLASDPNYPVVFPNYVTMDYTWKAYVRIGALNLKPFRQASRFLYEGEVVFEQITPNYTLDPWTINYGCQTQLSIVSNPSNPTIVSGGTIAGSNTTGVSVASGISSPTGGTGATGATVATMITGSQSPDPMANVSMPGSLTGTGVTDPALSNPTYVPTTPKDGIGIVD